MILVILRPSDWFSIQCLDGTNNDQEIFYITQSCLRSNKAMISNVRSGVVRPVVCTSRQSKDAPVPRAPTRRSALRLSVAMAAGPLIEIYVKGALRFCSSMMTHILVSFGNAFALRYLSDKGSRHLV